MKVRLQSGVIPFRADKKGDLQVLLLKKRTKDGWWGFPKGGLEAHLKPKENAAKECYEEAGVTGTVGKKIGTFDYMKDNVRNHVTMYAMEFHVELDSYPEKKTRQRKWVSLEQAERMLSKEHHRLLREVSQIFHRL